MTWTFLGSMSPYWPLRAGPAFCTSGSSGVFLRPFLPATSLRAISSWHAFRMSPTNTFFISARARVFFLRYYPLDLLLVGRPHERLPETAVLHQPGNAGERLEMFAGGVLGRQEQEEQVRGLAVQGVELDAPRGTAEREHEPLHALYLAVRFGDTLADAGAAERLLVTHRAVRGEQLGELAQHVRLVPCAELVNDELVAHRVRYLEHLAA